MWFAEIKVWHENSPALELTKKYNVQLYNFYLNAFTKGRETYLSRAIYVSGPSAQDYLRDLVKDRRIQVQAIEGNQLFYVIKARSQYHSLLCGKRVFFVEPNRLSAGFEYWRIAAQSKNEILDLVKRINHSRNPRASAELLKIKKTRINLFLPTALDGLTSLQAKAIRLAFENGYYDYPRRSSVKQLAQISHMPRTTLQEHLQKAEAKVLGEIAPRLSDSGMPGTVVRRHSN